MGMDAPRLSRQRRSGRGFDSHLPLGPLHELRVAKQEWEHMG